MQNYHVCVSVEIKSWNTFFRGKQSGTARCINQKQQTRRDNQNRVTEKPGFYVANRSTKLTNFQVPSPKQRATILTNSTVKATSWFIWWNVHYVSDSKLKNQKKTLNLRLNNYWKGVYKINTTDVDPLDYLVKISTLTQSLPK